MSSRWFEIALEVPATLVDEAAALLDFAGFGGVEVRDNREPVEVVVVVEADDEAGAEARAVEAADALDVLGAGAPRTTELDSRVWTENWKKHFARRSFAGRVEVLPPWEQPSPASAGLLSIVINPGMAFGTGLHETTASCLELLVDEVKPGMRVADVGCGSGILAIAAARLGAREVVATDIDPLAVDATNENIEANGVASVVRVELEPDGEVSHEWESEARPGLTEARSPVPMTARTDKSVALGYRGFGAGAFDLLVANILAETLVEMREDLAAAVREGGTLVLSGIEARRLKMVEEAFIRAPWRAGRTVAKGDWVSLSLHRGALGSASDGA